jgi:ribosomal protein S18 acetylase RimI-like enzyme
MIRFEPVENGKKIEQVACLAREIWREHYTPIIGQEQVEYMLENFQSPWAIKNQMENGALYYLLFYRDRDAGYLALVPDPDKKEAKLSKIYVRSDLRGIGLGRGLLEHACRVCRELGIQRLWLTVNKHNHRSISFYEQTGFVRAGTIVQDIGGGFVMDDYKMVKIINSA